MTIMRKHEGGGVDQVRLCLFKHWSLTNYGIHIHYYEPFTSSPLFNPMESMNGCHSLALPPSAYFQMLSQQTALAQSVLALSQKRICTRVGDSPLPAAPWGFLGEPKQLNTP